MTCERCSKRGIESSVAAVLTVSEVTDELSDGTLQLSNHDAFTMALCKFCEGDVVRLLTHDA